MADIFYTGQDVLKTNLEGSIEQMITALNEYNTFLKKMKPDERLKLIVSGDIPVIDIAWKAYINLKNFFGDYPLSKMQDLSGLPITREGEISFDSK